MSFSWRNSWYSSSLSSDDVPNILLTRRREHAAFLPRRKNKDNIFKLNKIVASREKKTHDVQKQMVTRGTIVTCNLLCFTIVNGCCWGWGLHFHFSSFLPFPSSSITFRIINIRSSDMIDYVKMSHFKIILETYPMICLCNKYHHQNTS